MLDFLSTGSAGLQKIRTEFGEMLDAGRQTFDAAADALLGGTEVGAIRGDLFNTERRIDEAERKIRRDLVVHASVHGTASFPTCLVLMSVAKDAERLGDYASNIFDLAVDAGPLLDCDLRDQLMALKKRISSLIAECRKAFDRQDRDTAISLIASAEALEDDCDAKIAAIVDRTSEGSKCAACALAFRYFKRTASHVLNILTSIVQPVDMLDFTGAVQRE